MFLITIIPTMIIIIQINMQKYKYNVSIFRALFHCKYFQFDCFFFNNIISSRWWLNMLICFHLFVKKKKLKMHLFNENQHDHIIICWNISNYWNFSIARFFSFSSKHFWSSQGRWDKWIICSILFSQLDDKNQN